MRTRQNLGRGEQQFALAMLLDNRWLILAGMTVTFLIASRVLSPSLQRALIFVASQELTLRLAAVLSLLLVVGNRLVQQGCSWHWHYSMQCTTLIFAVLMLMT